MKKEYKILIVILAIEILGISVLNELGVAAHSWSANVISGFIFLIPILILLYLLSKDNNISERNRILSKVGLGFIVICFLVGMVGKAIALGLIRL